MDLSVCTHMHTLACFGYFRMQKSNKVKDESAFDHSTLYAEP